MTAWNKGETKETHPSVRKTSETFIQQEIDNFAEWRRRMKKEGKIKSSYPPFKKDGDLAELLGVVLGDGNITQFPRTQCLRIVGNSNNPEFANRYASIIERIFKKPPSVRERKTGNAFNITIYEKKISERLGIPAGSKLTLEFLTPPWIEKNRNYILRFLRGLYESDGTFATHEPTYTYKFTFTNKNPSLLREVKRLLEYLGFHPHESKYKIQVSKKAEVYAIKDLLKFRQY